MTGRPDGDNGESSGVVRVVACDVTAQTTSDVNPAPLVNLLSEIRGLRSRRDRGQISSAEYERRRDRLLEKL